MALELERVSKSYDSLAVLRDLSYGFPAAGTVALMGPSGCGKTTLLRLIAGLEHPDGGVIRLPGAGKVSMVFQEDRLLPGIGARGNLLAVLPGGAASQKLADTLLEACGLSQMAQKRPGELSGGMQRRVAVARAIAYGGDLLLLDEPFKGLDEATKKSIVAFVGKYRPQKGLTLLVTHDREEARMLADTVLEFSGPPLLIKNSPV